MNNNNARPIPEDKRNPAPMDPDAVTSRGSAAMERIGPLMTGSLASLMAMATCVAILNAKAEEMAYVRAVDPALMVGVTPESAAISFASALLDMAVRKASNDGIPGDAIRYAFAAALKSHPSQPQRAHAEVEAAHAAHAAHHGNPAPVKPTLDLSKLI